MQAHLNKVAMTAIPAPPPSDPNAPAPPMRVVITSIDIPFSEMVQLLIGLAIASIPAGIILALLYFIISLLLGVVLGHRF